MLKILITIIIYSLTVAAHASDAWSYCTSPDGFFIIEWDQLQQPETGPGYSLGDLVKDVPLKTVVETCILANSGQEVTSLFEVTSYKVYLMNIVQNFEQQFICSEGGSGIPANDFCDESTAKITTTYHVK
jgi:hypothetical protein